MDLIKLHMDNAEDLLARRISHLKRPFIARSILTGLDYRLLASLSALRSTVAIPPATLDASQPLQLFLTVFYGLQQNLNATIEVLDDLADSLDASAHPYIEQAFQLAAVTPEPDAKLPASSDLSRKLLFTHAAQLPEIWLQQGLQDSDDTVTAICVQRLGEQRQKDQQGLLKQYSQSKAPQTRLAALLALARQGCPAAEELAEEPTATLQHSLPAWHAACWLHPEKHASSSPLALAFTGKPVVLPQLIEQMEHATSMADAYQAWLWLTARNLPHYPAIQAADAPAQHVAPTPGTQPDTGAASRWVQQQNWHAEQHYFLGQPLTQTGLGRLVHHFTGRCVPLLATHQQLQGQPSTERLTGFCLPDVQPTPSAEEFSDE